MIVSLQTKEILLINLKITFNLLSSGKCSQILHVSIAYFQQDTK